MATRKELWNFEYTKDVVIELTNGDIIYCDCEDLVDDEDLELNIKPNKRTDKWWPLIDESDGLLITGFFVVPSEVKSIYRYKDKASK